MTGGTHRLTSLFSGKALLIIITVIASAGGFTLGYFVGQNASVSAAPSLPKPQVSDMAAVANLQNPIPDIKAEAQPSVGPSEHSVSAEDKQSAVTPVSHKISSHLPEASRPTDKAYSAKLFNDHQADQTELQGSTVSSGKKATYTVQASAYRSQKDADALKQSLEAKGYKVYIKKESNSKGSVFFKVRVGEFERKKEASVVALKLNKTEGLNAFATAKR
jgi:cell division septation protein DedD